MPSAWLGASRRLILSFVLVLLVPAAAVIWLGVRLIEQDRVLASRQVRERRESAADLLIAALEQALVSTERLLDDEATRLHIRPNDDAAVITLAPDHIEASPKDRLVWVPSIADTPEPTDMFDAGEVLEFRAKNYPAAAAAYRALTASHAPVVRAGALLRLARTLRKSGDVEEALRAYGSLMEVPEVQLTGLPAELVARRARCVVFEQLGRARDLTQEASSLRAGLIAARWTLDRGTFQSYWEQVDRWTGPGPSISPVRKALSAATEWIWQQRRETDHGEFHSPGRRALRFGSVHVTVLWRPRADRLVLMVAGPGYQRREWLTEPLAALDARGFRAAFTDAEGAPILGAAPTDPSAVERRSAAVTRLPWTILVSSASPASHSDELASRQRALVAGLLLLVGLVVAGGYFIVRAVSRELAVARLQSDFVSAVSHEFRTPLTSLRQFTDLLNDEDDLSAVKRKAFYQAQARATERLQRLVESLLDFGRMEAAARPYRLEPRSIGRLVEGIVDEFRRDGMPQGFALEASISESRSIVEVDTAAFSRALWNLLDNAVKYSGSSRTIWVSVRSRDGLVAVSVRDRGLGIPRREHRQIFNKFVRGTASRTQGITGTGIGLAMVRHIVNAHNGTVEVESAPGEGSTFTIVLPVKTEACES